jgi:hypothetical protein
VKIKKKKKMVQERSQTASADDQKKGTEHENWRREPHA